MNKSRSVPSFEAKLENEEEVLDALLMSLSRNQLDPGTWDLLHQAAVRDDRVSELAFAYESMSQGRKLKTQLPTVQAELYFRAATFFGDILGDEFGATTYLERALGASPAHQGAFERIDAQLTRVDDNKKLAELCVHAAAHRPKAEQVLLLKRAAVLFERGALEDKAIETYQALVKLDPADESLRNALEARYLKANRFRDVARMLEQALVSDPAPEPDDAARIRGKLVDVFASQLKEPERAMPHVEALLEADPHNEMARRVATRLLESKALAARAAAALATGAETTAERLQYLTVELDNTRGPKRRDVLRRVGILKQDELLDHIGAFEAFEQALAIDPADDELRARYVALGSALKGPLEVARTFARVSTVAKDAAVRSRITAEMGELLLRGGDAKRARTTLAGVLAAPSADPVAVLTAARALAGVYEAEGDQKNLAEVLGRIGEYATDEEEKQRANERVAELATEAGDVDKAIAAWRRLVDSPLRGRALEALEPLYEQRGEWIDLSFVLEQRARDTQDPAEARAIAYRAAEVLTTKAKDVGSASEAWRQMVEAHGPARDIYEQWIPLLESQRQWVELAEALSNDALLAAHAEKPPILARLGQVYLTRTRSDDAAIDAFRKALEIDPTEKTSRAVLEKLLVTGDHRLAAATVLEPVYRAEDNGANLLRVLDLKAQLSPVVQDRLDALEEAADVAAGVSREKAIEIAARGLAEAVESKEPLGPWLERFDRNVDGLDGKKKAQLLGKALGDREIDSDELGALAERVGEEHAAAGDVAAALAILRRALAYKPSSHELLARVDELLQEQGNPEERVALYRSSLERGADPARRRKLLHSVGSIERYELNNPDAAILAYQHALADDPQDNEAHGALVELYTETEAWEQLCDVLEDHLSHASTPEESRRTRGHLAEIAARHVDSGRAAMHAGALLADPSLEPGELDLVERVAELLGDTNLLTSVLERRAREATEPKVQLQCLERLADLANDAGQTKIAIERLRQAAETAQVAADEPAAIQLLNRIRALDPQDPLATQDLVGLYERAEEFGKLPDLYATLLESADDEAAQVELYRSLARVHVDRLQDIPRAFDASRKAFALAPDHREVLAELEALAMRANRGAELASAIDDALGRVEEGSTWTELVLAKARVLSSSALSAPEAAIAFRAVLEKAHDEGHVNAAAEGFESMLRSMSPGTDRTTNARWLHEWRVGRAPRDQRSRALLAWASAEETDLADPAAALALYRRVLDADKEDLEALGAVTRLSLAAGDVDGALRSLEQRRAISDAKGALDVEIAGILAQIPGRESEALDRISTVLETAPQDPGALELGATMLANPALADRAAKLLESSLDAVDDPETKIDILRRLIDKSEPRLDLYERLLDLHGEQNQNERAFEVILRAARELPQEAALWDRAENLARQTSAPEPLAQLYEHVLKGALPKDQVVELGQRAVAFYEEWFEDGGRVVTILERLLENDPQDGWAFDRLKLIFDAQERWDDLFALYDRAAADADRDRRIELLEEAAQIAKDFANHSSRAIGYLEQLLELRPGNTRLISALERLYERHGCHRELIGLLGSRLHALPLEEAQKERNRIAGMWLDELGDPSSALIVVEDVLAHHPEGEPESVDVTTLLERVLAAAPATAEVRESVAPLEGVPVRRDSYVPMAQKRGLVRQRAAALLKERYSKVGREADLVRVLEVELEAVKSVKERIRRHQQIAAIYVQLGNDERAMEHFVHLVLLEPEVVHHRTELAKIAERVGRFERLADVLVAAADDAHDDALKVELLMHAGVVCAEKIGDRDRAIDLFFRILLISPITDAALLEACRHVEPLLAQAGRKTDRLDVLERLAILEETPDVRFHVLGEAARLAMELEEDDRAIWAWENRLESAKKKNDAEALDGLAFLFEKAAKWRPLIDTLGKRARLDARDDQQKRGDRVRVAIIQHEKLGAAGDAIETWQKVEHDFGESDEGTLALSGLYRITDRWTDLAELLTRYAARTTGPKSEILRELGDVQREQQGNMPEAIASYEAALSEDPKNEGSRAGLRALLGRQDHRPAVVRVLLTAYEAADDWKLVLDLTEHRLDATDNVSQQIEILMEAARISERRATDPEAAFSLVRRALLLDPGDDRTVAELFRLAELTRAYRSLADALRECLEGSERSWSRNLRFRMGGVLETRLDESRGALEAYVHVAHQDPADLSATLAVIRVAGKIGRWDASARAVIDSTRALGRFEPELVQALEDAANSPGNEKSGDRPGQNGWDALTFSLAQLVLDADLSPGLARDIEARSASWHRDRRGDPDASESAFQRALGHDPTNADILAELAKLQRRAKGRPLVDSLLRLSQATGGDLDLLVEAADTALASVGDRALAKSIFDRLLKLAAERWLGATEPNVISGTPEAPETYVDRATRELVRIHGDEGDHDKVVQLLVDTAHLPWPSAKARALRHEAARVAVDKLHATDRAIAIYLGLISEDPHDDEAVKNLVDLYGGAGRQNELLELKRRLVGTARSLDERLALRLEVAALEDGLGETTQAIATLEESLSEAKRHEATVQRLATLLDREKKVAPLEALWAKQADLAEGAGEASFAADLHARAAVVAERQNADVPGAIRHLERVVALEPRPKSLDDLARLSTTLKDHAAAATYLDQLRDLTTDGARADITLRLGEALVLAGKKAEAQAKLEEEVKRDPEADRVRTKLAEMYRRAESWIELAELLTEGAAHAPDKATRLSRLREAAELYRSRTPDRAIPLLEQASDLSPEDNGVKLALADVLGAAGRFEEARTLLRGLVEAFGGRRPKERAPVHYHLALLDLAVGDRARALVELDAATRIDPANPEILRALAELARDDGQLDRAERSYRALLTVLRREGSVAENAPITRSEVMFELSAIALRQGEVDRAKEILESAFELSTESVVEARRLEGVLRKASDHANLARASESRLSRGGEHVPDRAALLAELGRLYEDHLGRAAEALTMRIEAIALDPTDEASHAAAMRLDRGTAYLDRLEKLTADAEKNDPELAAKLFVRMARQAEGRDEREAARLYEKAHEMAPRDREILSALDVVFERLGDDAGQARVLGARVGLDASEGGASADALYRLAQLRFRSDQVDAACDAFEEAFAADPDPERAEALLKSAADAHPTSERLLEIYERLARAPGRERSLVDALVRKWALPGSGVDAMREAVEIAQGLQDGPLAEELLRRWLESGKEDAEGRVWALSLLAAIAELAGRVREAVLLKREAAELAPPDEARTLLFDVAKLASGALDDLKLAATIYEELRERDPIDREAFMPLLDVYRRMNEYDRLATLLADVVGYVDDVQERSKLRLERVRIGMERLRLPDEDAAKELREIVDEDPTAANAAILLGTILERSGREEDLAQLLASQLDGAKDRQDAQAVSTLSRRLGQLLEKNDRDQARDVYYTALDWDPNAVEIMSALERIHETDQNNEGRADIMERRLALETGPAAETLALDLASIRAALDDTTGSLRALEVGFRAAPSSTGLRDRLEAVYREQLEYGKLAELWVTDARGRENPAEKAERLRDAARLTRDELADPEAGSTLLREAREATPDDDTLLDELVDMLMASGELKQAIEELTGAIDRKSIGDLARVHLVGRRGVLRSRLGDADGGLADLEEAVGAGQLDLRGQLADHHGKLALSAAGRGDILAWKMHRLRVASLKLATGAIEEARNILTELLKTDSKDKATLRAIAHVDELEERWDQASATYRRLVGLEEGDGIVSAALKLAETCEKAGRLADARGGLERARMAAPENKALRERLAWLYEQLGALKELAELVLEEARAAGDVAPRFEGLMRAGQIFLELAQDPASTAQIGLPAAIQPLEEAHALRPADLDCAALLSDAYVGAGRFDESADLLQKTIATFKGRRARELSALYHRLARIAEMLGDKPQELQHLTTALDMDAQNGVVASELASLAMEIQNWDVAQRALRAVTMLKTQAPLPKALAYQHLGEIARQQGDSKRAMMLLKRAIDDDPTLESARALLDALQSEG